MTEREYDTDDFLAHYGVKGMRWGRRKDETPSAIQVARADRKEKKALAKTKTYRGIKRDRQVVNQRIRERLKSDPEYAKAVAKLNSRQKMRMQAAIIAVGIGISVGPPLLLEHGPTAMYRLSRSDFAAKVNRGTNYVRKKATYNPKSPFWDGNTVPGTVVTFATDLVRRY